MIISVASGKGGTGKTTVATNLALSLEGGVRFLDCDVEEPNAHIFLKPELTQKSFVSIPVPKVDKLKCTLCGRCRDVCAFNAIALLPDDVLIFPELCHGCGACHYFCPEGAISEVDKIIGVVETGHAGDIEFINGRLDIGAAIAPPIIKEIKKGIDPQRTVIIDAPPGTSCPVIEAVRGSDYCILVTEPTPFGLNDLMLAVEVLRELKIPFGVVINRADLGNKDTQEFCAREGIPILMTIPFKKEMASCYSRGVPVIEEFPEYKSKFQKMFEEIKKRSFA